MFSKNYHIMVKANDPAKVEEAFAEIERQMELAAGVVLAKDNPGQGKGMLVCQLNGGQEFHAEFPQRIERKFGVEATVRQIDQAMPSGIQ